MKVVTPFRPFTPESGAHLKLGPFDWMQCLRMLDHSVRASNGCEVHVLTDFTTAVPLHAYRYECESTRLMLWLLEVVCCYLESDDFDEDTFFICADGLVFSPMQKWFGDWDLGILFRPNPKFADKVPVLNGEQFFSHHAKDRLAVFYRQALELAKTLPEKLIKWHADTVPFCQLLAPLEVGIVERCGLRVNLIAADDVVVALPTRWREKAGRPRNVIDFRGNRKLEMREFFTKYFGAALEAR